MPFASGSILPSTVKAVKKGAVGAAGELRGDFDLTGDLGDLYANTESGIFGTLDAGTYHRGSWANLCRWRPRRRSTPVPPSSAPMWRAMTSGNTMWKFYRS